MTDPNTPQNKNTNDIQIKPVAQVASPTPSVSQPVASKAAPNPAAGKKVMMGCVGAFGGLMLIFLILSFIFLAQSDQENNPIIKLLGVSQTVFINSLITFVHLIFILCALTAFVFTMVGLFKASLAKKGDVVTRKAGLRTSVIAGITLLVILIVWVFAYLYLDAKRVKINPQADIPIVTDPVEPLNLTAPVEVKFDANNVPFDSNTYQIAAYDWDFGDKGTGTGKVTSHVYTDKGAFEVKLSITLKDKKTGELLPGGEYQTAVSVAAQALSAIIGADPQSGEAPLKVKLTAKDSVDPDGTIATYDWDLDEDGAFDDSSEMELTHTFDKVGTYKISLRVTSTTGKYNVAEKDIVVSEKKVPTAVITVLDEPAKYITGIQYTFKADESTSPNGAIDKYEWDFGDNSKKATNKTVGHLFANPGTYEVTLKVTDEKGETGEITKEILVTVPQGTPSADLKTDPALSATDTFLAGKVPFTVAFDASGSTDSDNNIVDYEWDFETDGKVDGYGTKITHTFEQVGNFTTTVSVVDANNNIGKKSVIIKVEKQGLIADLKADKVQGSVPLTVTFDASGSSYQDGEIVSYRWNFGDNTAPKLGAASLTHRYEAIGIYTASVTVIASDNTTAAKEITINVREIGLQACFVSVFEKGPAPLETTFDPGCSTGSISKYFWDFGDSGTSTTLKPTHVFTAPGNYRVTLEVSDADNTVSKAEAFIEVTAQ